VAGAVLVSSVGLILSPQADGWRWLLTSWPGRTFVVGVALTLIGNAATWRREKRLGRFQRRVAELEKQAAALEDRVETRTRDYYAQFRTELAGV
jgi:C4-dicarboxylate-specific signal transduction histidine kinase